MAVSSVRPILIGIAFGTATPLPVYERALLYYEWKTQRKERTS
jgi:hypothetical protein